MNQLLLILLNQCPNCPSDRSVFCLAVVLWDVVGNIRCCLFYRWSATWCANQLQFFGGNISRICKVHVLFFELFYTSLFNVLLTLVKPPPVGKVMKYHIANRGCCSFTVTHLRDLNSTFVEVSPACAMRVWLRMYYTWIQFENKSIPPKNQPTLLSCYRIFIQDVQVRIK